MRWNKKWGAPQPLKGRRPESLPPQNQQPVWCASWRGVTGVVGMVALIICRAKNNPTKKTLNEFHQPASNLTMNQFCPAKARYLPVSRPVNSPCDGGVSPISDRGNPRWRPAFTLVPAIRGEVGMTVGKYSQPSPRRPRPSKYRASTKSRLVGAAIFLNQNEA